MNRHKDDNPSGCILLLFLLLAFAVTVMFLGDASAQGVEPVFWYRCDCVVCWFLDLQGNDVPVVWGTWVADYTIWGIYLDCRGSQYPECHNCWSVFDARRWER